MIGQMFIQLVAQHVASRQPILLDVAEAWRWDLARSAKFCPTSVASDTNACRT